jgi:hypothetical protein
MFRKGSTHMTKRIILSTPEEREAERLADETYRDHVIKTIEWRDGRADILTEDSYGFAPWWPDDAPRAKVGDMIRLYGIFGQPFKGVALWVGDDLVPISYTTAVEQEAEHAAWVKEYHRRLRRDNKASFKRYADLSFLPLPMRRRIERFREQHAANPDDSYVEPYELAPVLEADRLLKRVNDPSFGEALRARGVKAPTEAALGRSSYQWEPEDGRLDWPDTPEWRLLAFDAMNSKLNGYDYAGMKEVMPEMDDGHSGNTWGAAIALTRVILRDGDEAAI